MGHSYLDHGRTGPLLILDTLTTAIMVSTSIRAIKIKRDAEEGVRIVITLDGVQDLEDRCLWVEVGQVRVRIVVVIIKEIKVATREGVFRVWFGESATK